jgi:hypothetical protein
MYGIQGIHHPHIPYLLVILSTSTLFLFSFLPKLYILLHPEPAKTIMVTEGIPVEPPVNFLQMFQNNYHYSLYNNPEEQFSTTSPRQPEIMQSKSFFNIKKYITGFQLAHFCDERKCGTKGITLEIIKNIHSYSPFEFYEVAVLPVLLYGSEICG